MSGGDRRRRGSVGPPGQWGFFPLLLLVAAISFVGGCAGRIHNPSIIPPCPVPTGGAVIELQENSIPPHTVEYLSRMEIYCSAIDALRGG